LSVVYRFSAPALVRKNKPKPQIPTAFNAELRSVYCTATRSVLIVEGAGQFKIAQRATGIVELAEFTLPRSRRYSWNDAIALAGHSTS
ncbi:MAG: hypothetical protein ACKPKO_02755, partial [Candidatus Fonsibacter sp.]